MESGMIVMETVFQYAVRVLAIFLAIVYSKSVLGKLKDIYGFSVVLGDYKVLPKFLVPFVAIFVPSAELAVSACLLIGGTNVWIAAVVGGVLQLSFALVMLINLNTVQPHGCGCFGLHSAEKLTITHVIKNGALFAGFAFIAFFPSTSLI